MSRRYMVTNNLRMTAGLIAQEVVHEGKSDGWSGTIEERDQVASILKPFGIQYVDDMTGTWAKHTSKNASAIFDRVFADMQRAEELGGPEGAVYLGLMGAIEGEARRRADAYRTTVNAGFRTFLLHGGDCDGETVTLKKFLEDNEDMEDTEVHDALLALKVGEKHEEGGGAQPVWSLTRLT
jgi:hypothetical protein